MHKTHGVLSPDPDAVFFYNVDPWRSRHLAQDWCFILSRFLIFPRPVEGPQLPKTVKHIKKSPSHFFMTLEICVNRLFSVCTPRLRLPPWACPWYRAAWSG